MIKVLFTSRELLLSFLYPLSTKYEVEFHETYDELSNCFVLGDFVFYHNEDIQVKAPDCIDVLVDNYLRLWSINFDDDYTLTERFIKSGKKVFIVDMENETLPSPDIADFVNRIEKHQNVYFINSRNYYKNTSRSISNTQYLQLFQSMFYLYDFPHLHPKLPKVKVIDQPYDFIAYLGLENVVEKGAERFSVIRKIEKLTNKTVYKCESFKNRRTKIQKKEEVSINDIHNMEQMT